MRCRTGFTASAITAFLPTVSALKNSHYAACCSPSPMLPCRLVAAKSAGNSPITRLIFALLAVDGWSRSAHSHDHGRRVPRPGTTVHDCRTLADNRRVGGPGRDGGNGDEFLRREHRRCTDSGAHVVLPPLARRYQAAVRLVRRCRPPFTGRPTCRCDRPATTVAFKSP